ncbi:MAG: hypothetical protein ACQEQV_09790 [Fibrobacterota bacterium]
MDIEEILLHAESTLKEVTGTTFETIAFANVEEANQYDQDFGDPLTSEECCTAQIEISLKENPADDLRTSLTIPKRHVDELVYALAPERSRISEQDRKDMVGELLNTLIGTFMLSLEQRIGAFTLHPPLFSRPAPEDMASPRIKKEYIIDDRYPVQICICVNRK